mmetsp:Transcript_37331/g.94150  ORF Transcript_37331/g.94150 Transcript_37331/m.94150 type:complete len:403 (+) Transcript_37331:171-1379(+)
MPLSTCQDPTTQSSRSLNSVSNTRVKRHGHRSCHTAILPLYAMDTGGSSPSRMILRMSAVLLALMAARHALTMRVLGAPTRSRAARCIMRCTSLRLSISEVWLVARLSCSTIRSLLRSCSFLYARRIVFMSPRMRTSSARMSSCFTRLELSAMSAFMRSRVELCSSICSSTPLNVAMALGKSAVEERSPMPKNSVMSVTMSPATSMLSVLIATCTTLFMGCARMTRGARSRRHMKCASIASDRVTLALTLNLDSIQCAMRGMRSLTVKVSCESGSGTTPLSTAAYMANLGSSISSSKMWNAVEERLPTSTLIISTTHVSFSGRRGTASCVSGALGYMKSDSSGKICSPNTTTPRMMDSLLVLSTRSQLAVSRLMAMNDSTRVLAGMRLLADSACTCADRVFW